MLMDRRVEAAILDHANPRILDGHVRAAAFEAPLDDADEATLGPEALWTRGAAPRSEADEGGLRLRRAATSPPRRSACATTSADSFSVVDAETGAVLGSVERERAYSTVHEGAMYLHMGQSYRVLALDLESRAALVERFEADYYTQVKKETQTRSIEAVRGRADSDSGSTSRSAACR